MAKPKIRRPKKPGMNPAKKKAIIHHRVETEIDRVQNWMVRERSKMLWCLIVALDEVESLTIDGNTLLEIIDQFNKTHDEYLAIEKEDGEEIANEKLNMRVNRILGIGDMEDTPDKLFGPPHLSE